MAAEFSLSVDLDGIHHHLQGYGVVAEPARVSPIYSLAVPRFLDLFARVGAPATFFSIVEDAAANAAVLRDAVARGHEVGSHSLTHTLPFGTLPDATLEREVRGSRELLEQATGSRVVGFRTPGWDVSPRVLAAIERAGYAYDSSVFPSPAQLAAQLSMWWRLGRSGGVRPLSALRFAIAPRLPHRRGGIWEVPVAVTRWLRMPYYQTLDFILGERVFDRLGAVLARGATPVQFALHGIDMLEPDEIDPRLHAHPGARIPLARKTERIVETLSRWLRTHKPVRLADRYGPESAR
jgi:hypothetical protein